MTTVAHRILQALHQADVSAFLKVSHWSALANRQTAAKLVSRTADGWLYPVIPLLLAIYSPGLALQLFYILGAGYAAERLLYLVLKKGIKRNRPPNVIPGFSSVIKASDEFSFPSGHTSAAFLAVTTLVLVLPSPMIAVLYSWSVTVALSRIVLGVHFPLDTVAGALLGSLTALTSFHLLTL